MIVFIMMIHATFPFVGTIYKGQDLATMDLYGDLEEKGRASEHNELRVKYEEMIQTNSVLKRENENLQQLMEILRAEKTNLERNISILYETATLELARKDRQISELRTERIIH